MHGAVQRCWRIKAVITVATGRRAGFTEVGEQRLAAAGRHLAQADQRVEFLALHLFEGFGAFGRRDPLALLNEILQPVGEPGIRRSAIATGPSGFLIISLDRLRQAEVGDKPHVGLIDAHAKCNGRDDDQSFFRQEALLGAAANIGGQSGVIGDGRAPFPRQPCRRFLNLLA